MECCIFEYNIFQLPQTICGDLQRGQTFLVNIEALQDARNIPSLNGVTEPWKVDLGDSEVETDCAHVAGHLKDRRLD